MSSTEITLNKYLADSGICSRRKAVELIKEGLVVVNKVVIEDPGFRVKTGDSVRCDGKLIKPQEKMYLLLNKPKGYVSTVSDPRHTKTVVSLVKNIIKDRVYPVGRLDAETTGLIILTNDGDFAQQLAHPRYEVAKVYHVKLDRPLDEKDMQRIRDGIHLSNGRVQVDRIYFVAGSPKNCIGIELHSGMNRVIRRIFARLGYDVRQLDRVAFSSLTKRGLAVGAWRFLTKAEITHIRANLA